MLLPDGTRLQVGVSIGSCGATRDEEALLRRADDALYRAKASGRDRVAVANLTSNRQEAAEEDARPTPLPPRPSTD